MSKRIPAGDQEGQVLVVFGSAAQRHATAAPGLGHLVAHIDLFPFHFCRWEL